jgi:VCBS repeat-containing protein
MTSLQWFYHLASKSLFTLAVSFLLFACSTEENLPGYPDSFSDADTSTEAAPSPATEPAPAPAPGSIAEPTPPPEPPPGSGSNSPAVIGGANTGSVTEDVDPDRDNLLEVSGKLSIFDSDAGESAFRTNARSGSYGTLNISAAGDWRYSASNGQTAIQSLPAGSSLTDTIRVSSIDGTTRDVIITIIGANDAATISGVSTGSVTEDFDSDGDDLLEVSGKLNITEIDTGESAFRARTRSGLYGSLTINAAGDWSYAANNAQSAIQSLKTGGKITDSIQVSSVDGGTRNITIMINGADDATVISGVSSGSVTEDVDPDGNNLLEASGKLTITDPDSGDAVFNSATHAGTYGSLTIDAAGNWRYSASNSLASIQNLNSGASVTDTLTVNSAGGAAHNVVITIAGADEVSANGDISLSWVAPVEREDGTPISMSEIAGYRVYYGTSQGNYTKQVEIAGSSTMQATLSNLASGTYYIVVTTYDVDGRESAHSQMVTRTI